MELVHIVSPAEDGLTLESLLRGSLALSGRLAREVKRADGVTVDGAPLFSNQRVRAGQTVYVSLPGYSDAEAAPPPPGLPPVRAVYEDEALLAVFKPAPLQCHPSPSAPGGSDTLEARVRARLCPSAHPVHRLDAETRGLVLFAKLPYAQAHLQRQMADGTFCKAYRAWVFGAPAPRGERIDAPIARLAPESFTRVVREGGARAATRYETLETREFPGGCASLVALFPETGRTHQLRVHMAHIGCPLLGDTRYASDASRALSDALGLPFHQLSAVSLSFVHPLTGKRLDISCDPEFDL